MKLLYTLLFASLLTGCNITNPACVDDSCGPLDEEVNSGLDTYADTGNLDDTDTPDANTEETDANVEPDPRPKPTVAVNPDSFDDLGTFDSIRGETVEVGGMRSGSAIARFPVGEILLTHVEDSVAQEVANRWNGRIVDVIDFEIDGTPKYFTIVVDPNKAPFSDFDELAKGLNIGSANDFSSQAALGTFLIALAEKRIHSLEVSLNYLFDGTSSDEEIELSGGVNLSNDKSYLESGGVHDMGVTDAWRLLAAKNRLRNKVSIMVIDGGFINDGQLPKRRRISGSWGEENSAKCGGRKCPWHGTNVVAAAMGSIDDVVTGPAAPVAELYAMKMELSTRNFVDAIKYIVLAPPADRPKVINMSFGARIPAIGAIFMGAYDVATRLAKHQGITLVASAGNDNEDVDDEDCFLGYCWEAATILPCEADGVICVGQLKLKSIQKARISNYGSRLDEGDSSVQIYAPAGIVYEKQTNGKPDFSKSKEGSGTSFASPIVAGVVALMYAAKPGMKPQAVTDCLLDSAHVGGVDDNGGQQRRVNALGAVKCALGDELTKPSIRMLSTEVVNNRVDLHFVAMDDTGEIVGVDWKVAGQPVGSSRNKLSFTLNQGRHYVRGQIQEGTSTSFSINVKNNPPKVIAYHPRAHHTYYENEKPVFITFAEDEPGFRAENLCWKFSVACHGGSSFPHSSWFHYSRDFFEPGIVGYEAIANDGIQTKVGGSFRILPIDSRNSAPVISAQVNSSTHLEQSTLKYPEPNSNQNEYRFTASATDAEDGVLDGYTMYWTRQHLNGKVEVLCDGGERDCSDFTVTGLISFPWNSWKGQTMVTVEVIDSRGATRQAHIWVGGVVIQ